MNTYACLWQFNLSFFSIFNIDSLLYKPNITKSSTLHGVVSSPTGGNSIINMYTRLISRPANTEKHIFYGMEG